MMAEFFTFNYILLIFSTWCKIPIKLYFMWMMIIFSIIAFIYDPFLQSRIYGGNGSVDLCRHFDKLDMIRLGVDDNLYTEAPFSALYLKTIAYIFDNNSFLPVISVWIYYGIYFFAGNKFLSYMKADKSTKLFALGMCILCGVFFWNMNNIRYPIAVIMFFLVMYYDIIKKLLYTPILYILPVLMHPGVLILICVRFMAKWKLKYSIIIFCLLAGVITSYYEQILTQIIYLLIGLPDIQTLFIAVSLKSTTYATENVYDVPLLYKLLDAYITLVMFIVYVMANSYNRNNSYLNVFYRMVGITILLATLGNITNFMDGNFVSRLLGITPAFMTLMTGDILSACKKQQKQNIKVILFCITLPYIFVYLFKIYPNWIYPGV